MNGIAKKGKITHGTPRKNSYSEIRNDDEWLSEDVWNGGDDHHYDVINYEPSDDALVTWVVCGGMQRWKNYMSFWMQHHRSDVFGIGSRMQKLIERYTKITEDIVGSR